MVQPNPGGLEAAFVPSAAILAIERRAAVAAEFHRRVSAGESVPFVIPFSILGTFIIPIAYFSLPHTGPNRQWLFRARWLVFALVVLANLDVLHRCYSANFAAAYALGAAIWWGILRAAAFLIFTRPQFEYRVIAKRLKTPRAAATDLDSDVKAERLDEDVRRSLGRGYEYYWQPYPSDSSFAERLRWSTNLLISLRGVGWSFAIPNVPTPESRAIPEPFQVVRMDTMPVQSRTGMTRSLTRRDFLLGRLWTLAHSYVLLDAIAILMMKDPYFIVGDPDPSHPSLPPYLRSITSHNLLCLYRYGLSIFAAWAALNFLLTLNDMCQLFLWASYVLGPVQAELWQYPTIYGSLTNIFRRGLSGFWGGFWHQTFRHAFTAPAIWLFESPSFSSGRVGNRNCKVHGSEGGEPSISNGVSNGKVNGKPKGIVKSSPGSRSHPLIRIASTLLALTLSGILHASGSYTTVSPTRPWRSAMFFIATAAGMILQNLVSKILFPAISSSKPFPRLVRQVANVLFSVGWSFCIAGLVADDFAASGLWLYEPVPWSPLRALGLSQTGDNRVWRWNDRSQMPGFWCDRGRWFECGITL